MGDYCLAFTPGASTVSQWVRVVSVANDGRTPYGYPASVSLASNDEADPLSSCTPRSFGPSLLNIKPQRQALSDALPRAKKSPKLLHCPGLKALALAVVNGRNT